MASVSVSVSAEFLGEMTRIVGSFGDVLIFDGQDEAISYLRDSDYLIYKDEEDLQEQVKTNYNVGDIFSQDEITEWVKDNCQIEEVFDDGELTAYARENNGVGDIFDDDTIVEWVQDNCEIEDVFGDEEIKKAYMSKVVKGAEFFAPPTKDNSKENEALKAENEALKAKVAELERATSDLQLLKNIFGDLIFNHRTAKDGQVWKFNADEGKGEWC
jgi:hypothetical protein